MLSATTSLQSVCTPEFTARQLQCVRLLVNAGTRLNEKWIRVSEWERVRWNHPLLFAVEQGNLPMVKLLLELKAEPCLRQRAFTPMQKTSVEVDSDELVASFLYADDFEANFECLLHVLRAWKVTNPAASELSQFVRLYRTDGHG